ncbi:hypothetical protein M1O20_05555 [Dehalococcoidia bacterium]|nr:hypothetical protein [Dehalococcoidia bacterium]MCL0090879.1 hypothetical protein [Dehalococcoidia bacterium]
MEQTLDEYFTAARKYLEEIGYDTKWVYEVSPESISPKYFFEQYIWVVYACNFQVKILEQLEGDLYRAYGDYETFDETRRVAVLGVINNIRKWNAVYNTAIKLQYLGWHDFKKTYLTGIDSMTALKFIGPVTKFHLARNLGFDKCKPDRHMCRLKESFGYNSVDEMCRYLAKRYGLQVKEIDLILWKYVISEGSPDC